MFGCFVSSVNNVSSAQRNCEVVIENNTNQGHKSHERVLNELKINLFSLQLVYFLNNPGDILRFSKRR